MWPRERSALCRELVAESQAFLLGHLADEIARRNESVPVWAWTNLLAHGSHEDLRAQRELAPASGATPVERWRAALTYLSAEVSGLAESLDSLAELQSDVLVPLELDLGSKPEVDWWSPGMWVKAVREKLAEYWQVRQREVLRARSSGARKGSVGRERARDGMELVRGTSNGGGASMR